MAKVLIRPYRVTSQMVQAAGAGRKYPTLSSVTIGSEPVTRNEDGQISSPGMTARYVDRFCGQNHYKR